MKSENLVANPATLREQVIKRDRAIAIAFLTAGGGVKAAAQCSETFQVNERLVYRAVQKHKAWALAEIAKEAA